MSVTVFGSARRSASSAFNLIAVTTETASRLVNTAARSVDMLDAKVATIHQDVIMDCKLDRKHSELIKVIRKATEITDELEELHRRNNPTDTWDRDAMYTSILEELKSVLLPEAKTED